MKKKNKAHDATKYIFSKGEPVLIDANVWLYLQPPAARPPPGFAWRYSKTLKNILGAGASPVIESLVLSEYLNRYLRLEYDVTWRGAYPNFKAFRKSGDFASLSHVAVADARQILKLAAPQDTLLRATDISDILAETEAGTLDFNDGVLIENCRLNGWKLLTNDGDMTIGGIEVLTTYQPLLAACP
jgi:predicted nucleic acid-binding protein